MAYDNNDSGMLARNKRKEKDTHPEYTGSVTVGGVEYWISAWVKVGGPGSKLEGEKFFSLAFTRKDAKKEAMPAIKYATNIEDDLPF